jgi:hypothetical protein
VDIWYSKIEEDEGIDVMFVALNEEMIQRKIA